ncbi:hypothetical protein ACCS54_32275 [Rhizobium johnstonii]|uniref:hypothetical protein n=2 Tax=Rhizobium/Agrobacterium group TaxID=227290 RepID=UPI0007E44CAD|nr:MULTISPECIES: hypothetical protein [Rhizobium]MDV4165954.1 hypothetical protein [Rhizobium leguminosarum]MDV4176506.1 hypothetical protein [Rhizobium leguminosarum]OAV51088.1 hypothetical protein A6U98_11220 [Rhizobium sp. WYCCWR10014]WSH75015.1 hypothetical protein U8Q02_27865 [Rhizobium leguminosarum]
MFGDVALEEQRLTVGQMFDWLLSEKRLQAARLGAEKRLPTALANAASSITPILGRPRKEVSCPITDPEMAIVNRRNLIITDLPDVIGDMLRQMGRRHTTKLSR